MDRTKTLLVGLLLLAHAALLAGCGSSSDDGAMLSDEEKIQKASSGRAAQMNAQGGKPTGDTPLPAAGTGGAEGRPGGR